MKQLLFLTCLFLLSHTLQAQKDKNPKKDKTEAKKKEKEPKPTKAEKKEYKRKAAELRKEFKEKYKNPEDFTKFKKDNAAAKKESDKLSEEANKMKKNEDTQKEQVATLKQMNTEDEAKIKELQENIKNKQKAAGKVVTPATIPTKGTFYAVHIGEANPEALSKILENDTTELRTSQGADGQNFYVLGLFADVRAAYALKQQITAMGIRKANVVTIKDGKLSL